MADLDVLTLAEAKQAISSNSGTVNDALVSAYITGVSLFLDRVCGPIVTRTITDELATANGVDLFLKQRPVDTVATVTEYYGTTATVLTGQTPGTTPPEGFSLYPEAGILTRLRSGSAACWASGFRNIKVTYVAGRFADTATVDQRFKEAARLVLANIYRREHGMAQLPELQGATYSLPRAAQGLLATDLLIRA